MADPTVVHVAKAGALLTGAEYESPTAHVVTINGEVPVGGIIMWSGTIASVPTHWAFCDGTLNAPGPDLRDKFVVGASLDLGGCYRDVVIGDVPISYWRLGESSGTNAVDEMGAHNGTYTGSPTLGVTGALSGDSDTAITLSSGTSPRQYVTSAFLIGTGAITLEAWTKGAHSNGNAGLIGEWDGSGAFLYIQPAGTIAMFVDGTSASAAATGISNGQWHHVVGTWDGANINLYVDGALVAGPIAKASMGVGPANFQIGQYNNANSSGFDGSIDEAAYYDYALTSTQVTTHYAARSVACGSEVAQSNIEGTYRISATQTDASIANHAALSHANGAVGNHTGFTHDGAVASHPDLTHAALSHAALTVVHADHSLASVSHTHASGADVSVPSGSFASTAAVSVPSGSIASTAAVSYPSHSHASAANASAPSGSFASTNAVSVPSGSFASTNAVSVPAIASLSAGGTPIGTVTRSVVTTGGLLLTLWSSGLGVNEGSRASAANASAPSGTVASAANASAPSGTIASSAAVSVPSSTGASGANASAPSGTVASVANASAPSGTIASTNAGSRPSATGSGAAVTVTHADHSLASLSHQAIGTHANLTHAFTPPAGHGTAGTVTHSFTQPDAHAALTHSTVAIVPAYYALAFIQRMA